MRKINVVCPYCGMKQSIEAKGLYNDAQVVVCDVIEGGCDRMFVADITVKIEAKGLKVEGADNGT